jgi:hypothetical protein
MDTEFRFDSSHDAASRYWYLPDVSRPAGASTQWLAFRFRLNGMVAHSPGSHFAVALRARLGFDPTGRAISISGRGLTLGDTSLAIPAIDNPHAQRPGFGGARGAQIESFWPGGNFLYAETAVFPDGLRDDVWYRLSLHVNDARWIAFELAQGDDEPLRACVGDAVQHPVIADACGALIGLGRAANETGEWSAEFRDINCGWF